jgi:hypothetical protein
VLHVFNDATPLITSNRSVAGPSRYRLTEELELAKAKIEEKGKWFDNLRAKYNTLKIEKSRLTETCHVHAQTAECAIQARDDAIVHKDALAQELKYTQQEVNITNMKLKTSMKDLDHYKQIAKESKTKVCSLQVAELDEAHCAMADLETEEDGRISQGRD